MWGSYLRHVRVPWALSWDPTSRGLPGGARKGLCIKIRGTHLHVSYKGEKRAQPSSWAWLCGLSSRDEVTGDRLHGLLRGPPGFMATCMCLRMAAGPRVGEACRGWVHGGCKMLAASFSFVSQNHVS